jgi:hypothetical protein
MYRSGPTSENSPRLRPARPALSCCVRAWIPRKGRRCLNEFAEVLTQGAAKMLPAGILDALETEEGHEVIDELWPDVANAYFKARLSPAPQN